MDILLKALGALWQVALVALVLGAGLPALFAVGVRALNTGRQVVGVGADASTLITKPSPAGLAAAVAIFALCAAAVLFGIVVIVFGKQLFGG